MQFSPIQTMSAPTAPHMLRSPQLAPPRAASPDQPDISLPPPPGPNQNPAPGGPNQNAVPNGPNQSANVPGLPQTPAGILSVKTKDGIKASYSEQSMSFKLADKASGETLIGFGTNAFALYNSKRGIAAAVSPTGDVVVQSGGQATSLGSITDPQIADRLRSFFPAQQCVDLIVEAKTHDLAKTSLGQKVVADQPQWLQLVKQRQMYDPRVLSLPAVQQKIALLQQLVRGQSKNRPTSARSAQDQTRLLDTETKDFQAMGKAYGAEEQQETQDDLALADSANPQPDDSADSSDSTQTS